MGKRGWGRVERTDRERRGEGRKGEGKGWLRGKRRGRMGWDERLTGKVVERKGVREGRGGR